MSDDSSQLSDRAEGGAVSPSGTLRERRSRTAGSGNRKLQQQNQIEQWEKILAKISPKGDTKEG